MWNSHCWGFGGGSSRAATASLKPVRAWEPSQKGLLADWPQRQSEITVRPASPKAAPEGSRISKSPSIRMGPLLKTETLVGMTGMVARRCGRGIAGWVLTRRRGGAEEDAEKKQKVRRRIGIHTFRGWRDRDGSREVWEGNRRLGLDAETRRRGGRRGEEAKGEEKDRNSHIPRVAEPVENAEGRGPSFARMDRLKPAPPKRVGDFMDGIAGFPALEWNMPASLEHISPDTPMGANLVGGGATFRVWAPGAHTVHLIGEFNNRQRDDGSLLTRDEQGHWRGFIPGVVDRQRYLFYVVGDGGEGPKRDPFARELAAPFPADCIVRPTGD